MFSSISEFLLVVVQLISNTIICFSYLSIPWILGKSIDKRERRQHAKLLRLFYAFIFLCGINQFLQAWNTWHDDYWLEAIALSGVAIASVGIVLELRAKLPGVLESIRDRAQQESWLHSVIKDSPTPVAFLDRNLIYLLHSKEWCLQLGLGDRDLRGLRHYDVFPEIKESQKIIHQEILTQGITISQEEDSVFLHGKKEIVSWKIQPMFAANHSVVGMIIFCEIVTERKEKEREIENKNEELEVFAYTASHDLRSPIRTVAKFADFIWEMYADKLDDDGKLALEYIISATATIDGLLDGLLEWSRVNSQRVEFAPCNLNELLASILKSMAADIQAKNALVGSQQLPEVECDRSQIGQVFTNLIANSLKFSSPEVPLVIGISCDESEEMWLFSLSDNGIGFDSKYYGEKIFMPFQRLVRDSEYAGRGIGLAIVAKIIARHGGKIWAESEPWKGATFCFTLPKTQGSNV
jgi:PAS domain S-box-containing protein